MAVDEYLIERLRQVMSDRNVTWYEKRMFGGVCFMVDDKMCFGVGKNGLMARVAPEDISQLSVREGAAQMMHGGKPFTGYMMITPDGFDLDEGLEFWVDQCLAFNPLAKKSKGR